MTQGATFVESWEALVDAGFPKASAFTTTMRAYRSGGLTKDAIYLRGLVDLLCHLKGGGSLEHMWLGKFSLSDLPLIQSLAEAGILNRPRLLPRWLDDTEAAERLSSAAEHAEDVTRLVSTPAPTPSPA